MIGVCGAALIALLMSLILGGMGFRGARLLCMIGTVILYLFALNLVDEICGLLFPLIDGERVGTAIESVLKIVGVSYAASFVADMCRDAGEAGISNAVITVGRVEILLIATPYAVGIAEIAIGLMGG